MKRAKLSILLLLLIQFSCSSDDGVQPVEGAIKVLFLGNSYTYFNSMPSMLAQLVHDVDQRPPLYYGDGTIGGAALETLWNDGGAQEFITNDDWDYVVLQEGSGVHASVPHIFLEYARKFDAIIKNNSAKTLLFQTWAASFSPEDQEMINGEYEEVAGELNSEIVPVGNAWKNAMAERSHIGLHGPDGYHPSVKGSYLAALVFYAWIYDTDPAGLPFRYTRNGAIVNICSVDEAEFLQRIAWETVRAAKN